MIALPLLLALAIPGAAAEESLDYKYWSRCKPGSWVKIRMDIQQAAGKVIIEETTTLLERDPEKVVLGFTRVTTAGGATTVRRDQKRAILAKTAVPEKIEKESTEDVKVGGRTLTCRRLEMTRAQNNARLKVTIWVSGEIPGGVARSEIKPVGADSVAISITALTWEKK